LRKKQLIIVTILLGLLILFSAGNGTGWNAAGKGEIVILQGGLPDNLDPVKNSSFENALPISGIYEGLVKLNPETLSPEPCIADSWDVSEDGKRWTFFLKPGIHFSDGTPCDAEAVKASMSRAMELQDSQPYSSFVFGPVSSIETEERYTISFNLKHPFSPFLKNLALPFGAPVVSPSALKKYGDQFWKHPSGTGPYLLKQHDKDTIVLQSNPRHRREPALTGRITFKAVPDSAKRTKYLLEKKADIIFFPGRDNTDKIRAAGMKLISRPGLDVSYLGFYTDKPPFNNKILRNAVAGGLDREKMVADVLDGEGIPAASIVPPPISCAKNTNPVKYSPDQVRRILSREGYPDGINLTLVTYQDSRRYCPPGGKALAEEIKRQLEPAGIRVTIQSRPWDDHKEAIRGKTGDLFLYGWTGDNGDPDNFMYTLLSSSQIEHGLNTSGYINNKLDVFLVTARRVSDFKSRSLLYSQAEGIIQDDIPVLPLNHSMVRIAHGPGIQNLMASGFGLLDLYSIKKG